MSPRRREKNEFRRFFVAILASLVTHLLLALLILWYLNRTEEPLQEPEKVPITPFEVAVIEEPPKDPGKKQPPSNQETDIPLPESPTSPSPLPTPAQPTPKRIPKPTPKNPPQKPKPAQSSTPDPIPAPEPAKKATQSTRSTVFLPTKTAKTDFRVSQELFNSTFGFQENQKLTQKLRGQKRFVGLAEELQMAKVTLSNVSGGTIRPGNHSTNNSETAQEFLHRLHNYIHQKWAFEYIPMLNQRGSNTDKINDLSLNAEIELVLQGSTGKPLEVVIARSSGVGPYDTKAVMVTKLSATTGPVPKQLWSSNGKVYIHWNFWRDQRQCGIFGANVYILDESQKRRRTVTGVQ